VIPLAAQTITGAGSTFAYPIVARWVAAYHARSGHDVSYQPVGSTAGETAIRAGIVDFAVSDAPLQDAQLLRDGLSQFPLVMGAIVPVVNLDGIGPGQLHMPAEVLADIYLGRVTRWDDPAIKAANAGVSLPHRRIQVIYRSDGSGTTFNWTSYLAQGSVQWRGQVGSSTKVAWPVGAGVQGTSGMAAAVARIGGAIGYIEYSAARKAGLTFVLAQNRAGHYVMPAEAGYLAATDRVDWKKVPDFAVVLTDTVGPDAYPLMATSFVLMRAYGAGAGRSAMLDFFRFALEDGRDMARAMDYLPLSQKLAELVEATWPPNDQVARAGAR
jgi:phosphate transport system substrate-binding protein